MKESLNKGLLINHLSITFSGFLSTTQTQHSATWRVNEL